MLDTFYGKVLGYSTGVAVSAIGIVLFLQTKHFPNQGLTRASKNWLCRIVLGWFLFNILGASVMLIAQSFTGQRDVLGLAIFCMVDLLVSSGIFAYGQCVKAHYKWTRTATRNLLIYMSIISFVFGSWLFVFAG